MANETLEQLGNALEAAQQKIGAVAEEVSEQAYNELVAIRREKLRGLQEAGNDPFELTSYPQADFAAEVKESFVDVPEGEQGRSVCMAGRMMSKRVMGKASFCGPSGHHGQHRSFMSAGTTWVWRSIRRSRNLISAISSASEALCSVRRWAKSACMRTEIVLLSKSPAASAGKIPRPEGHASCGTASAMWI